MQHRILLAFWVTMAMFCAVMVSFAADSENDIAALSAAEKWLAMVDSEKYAESWASAAVLFKQAIQPQQWEQAMKSGRQPLGKLIYRKMIAKAHKSSLPGAPDGQYIVFKFDTSFEHKKKAVETVTAMLDENGLWRVSGYFIK